MSLILLTTEQKTLLRTLVDFIKSGKLKEPIVPFPVGNPTTQYAIYLKGEDSFKFKRISDLDSLCDAGLLNYRWNRYGSGKLYYVSEAGTTAVDNNFQAPVDAFAEELSLALLVATLSGGRIVLDNDDIEESKTVGEIADDPVLRHTAVTLLITSLQKTAEDLLPWPEFRSYYNLAQQLQAALLTPNPKTTALQTLFSQLATPQANLTVWPQFWAHLYPLLLIAQLRAL